MKIIDGFLDDYDKRCFAVFMVIVLLWLSEMFYEVIFAKSLMDCRVTADLLKLAGDERVMKAFMGRVLVYGLDYSSTSMALIKTAVKVIRIEEIILMVLSGAYLFTKRRPENYLHISRSIILYWAVFIAKSAILGGYIVYSLASGSTAIGIERIAQGAAVYRIINIVMMPVMLTDLFVCGLRQYGQ